MLGDVVHDTRKWAGKGWTATEGKEASVGRKSLGLVQPEANSEGRQDDF